MNESHSPIDEWLQAELDGELGAEEQARLRELLVLDPNMQRDAELFGRICANYQAGTAQFPAPDFRARVMSRIRAEQERAAIRNSLTWIVPALSSVVLCGIVWLLLSSLIRVPDQSFDMNAFSIDYARYITEVAQLPGSIFNEVQVILVELYTIQLPAGLPSTGSLIMCLVTLLCCGLALMEYTGRHTSLNHLEKS